MQTSASTSTYHVGLEHLRFELRENPQTEDFYLVLACKKCGDESKKPCAGVEARVRTRIIRYALDHLHADG